MELLHPRVATAIARHGIQAEVMQCDPALADTAEFCKHYGFAPERTCNAIVVAAKTDPIKYACCLVLATHKLDVNKTVCRLLDVKRCSFASGEQTVAATDMQIGGVTPVGVDDMPVFVDQAVAALEQVVLGGGNRSSKLLVRPSELLKMPNLQVIEGLGLPR